MTSIPTSGDSASAPQVWRQYILVAGDSLSFLQSISNIGSAQRSPKAMIFLQGDGPWFPAMHGASWAAKCEPRLPHEAPASDIGPILRALLEITPLPTSSAPAAEVDAWVREHGG